jgi:signal transduction histidine kinase
MIPDQIRPARRLAEFLGRLHAILGTPGLMIGLFSLVSLGFGPLVVAREYDRLRRTGREALHRVLEGWVRTASVDDLGLTLADYAAFWRRARPGEREDRRVLVRQALLNLGDDLDRQAERFPLIQVVAMDLAPRGGPALASWRRRPERPSSPPEVEDRLAVPGAGPGPGLVLTVRYRAAPEVEQEALGLEASYRRLLLELLGLSGFSLLCLGYMVLHARGLRERAARAAAREATLDLADRTCHEMGNVIFILSNERSNLVDHLDLVQRFVDEAPEALAAAAGRAGLEPPQAERLRRALRQEYAGRGLDPEVELRGGMALARDICRQLAVCSEYISLTVRELDGYLNQAVLPVAPGPVAVSACLTDALALLGPRLQAAAARVDRPTPADEAQRVLADRRLLVHALINLLRNAVEAAADAGEVPHVTVTIRTEGTLAWIRVADNGPGVPEAARARIFDLGYTTKGVGRGRGLAIVRESVRAQGGKLLLADTPGRGAVFALGLPLAGPDAGPPPS